MAISSFVTYRLVILLKTCYQVDLKKTVFHKVMSIGITYALISPFFYGSCPLSPFPLTMPGINAKITGSVSPASFPWLSEILAQHLFLGPSRLSSHLLFIPFSQSHLWWIFPGLKDLVQRTSLLVLILLLGARYLGYRF